LAEEEVSDGDEKKSDRLTAEEESPPEGFSTEEVSAIKEAVLMIKSKLDIQWLPEYGSVMVAHRGDLQMPGTTTISILGLDRHECFLHDDDKGGYQHEADAMDYKVLVVGTLEEEMLQAFWSRFQQLHNVAKVRDGDRRTAVGGRQGHQFTPALIHALATQAIKCGCKEGVKCSCPNIVPKGGFTDVGRHTGGSPRNTSFALVKFLMEWCLVQFGLVDKVLFQKMILCIHLCILEDRVLRSEEDSEGAQGKDAWKVRADLDVAFRILEVISMEGDELFESGTSIKFVFEKASDIRLRIDKVVQQLAQSEAKRFVLPDVDSILQDPDSFRSPRIHLPDDEPSTDQTSRNYEERIKKNIGPTELFRKGSGFDLNELLAWLKAPHFNGKRDATTVLLRLRTVEDVFWSRALDGFDAGLLNELDLERLLAVVNEYRKVFHSFEGALDKGDLIMPELHSRELLVVWIAYCLAFATVKRSRSGIMSDVGVALKYSDLGHLVLSDENSWKVLMKVATFLNQNYYSEKTELFSFRAPTTTFHFAEDFARNDRALRRIWEAERSDAESRMDRHWEEVLKKKNEAKQLRLKISGLSQQLNTAEVEEVNESASYRRRCSYEQYASRSELERCESKVMSLKQKIAGCKRRLDAVLRAPSPVCQPLPSGESSARRWLFFLHMPSSFRVLSTLSITGQQMLVPRPWKAECNGPDGTEEADVLAALLVTNGECLSAYYNFHQNCEFHALRELRHGIRGDVALVSPRPVAEVLPKTIGPTSVDSMFSREDGVWYPDSVACGMEWTGGSLSWDCQNGQAFDPFQVPREWTISYFTEKLGQEGKPLQWAMRLEENSDIADERGNRALACQETRPHWLSKPQFLAFCGMRAFPYKQLRQVVVALLDRSLPLQQRSVHSLLKQTLFHVGKLDTDQGGNIRLGWKYDLTDGSLLGTCRAILDDFVKEISESPSSYLSALIVGDIVGFLSDWNQDLKAISRRLAKAACDWATDYGCQAESTEKAADSVSFRIRQRLLLSVSILCLTQGPMNDEDVRLTIQCRAVAKNVCVDEQQIVSLRSELSRSERRCDSTVAGCIGSILQIVKKRQSILTDAIRAVIAVVPDGLKWTQRGSSSSSFTATGSDGCMYAINVLTGTVLINGLPPSSLPSDILEHRLYQRSFGERNFEVVAKNEVYETVRRVGGFLYSFTLKSNGKLCIMETSEDGETLELLDGTAIGIEKWAEEMPTRLKQMHSHWLSRRENMIVLRGRIFFEREVYFILCLSLAEDGIIGNCRVVPDHLKSSTRDEIPESLLSFPRLVLHDSALVDIFAKFEDRQFVHLLISGSGSSALLDVSLPRYGLTFMYRDGQFQCAEISGFALTKCQQLEGTLFGFEQYLVIHKGAAQSGDSTTSILVVDGDISLRKLDGSTFLKTATACDANTQWHKYDMHSRFQVLSAGTVSSRLHLAALHASTSFLSPDCDSLLTGFERSIELIRGSWVARLFSDEEKTCLYRLLSACKGRHPPLALLCCEVMQSSISVPFLYNGAGSDGSVCDEWKSCATESSKYLSDLEQGLLNCRNRLSPCEERRVLGQTGRMSKQRSIISHGMIVSPPVQKDIGKQMENELQDLCEPRQFSQDQYSPPEFPLRADSQTALEEDILAELHASWDMHHKSSNQSECKTNIPTKIANLQGCTSHLRRALEDYIQSALNNKSKTKMPSGLDLKRLSRIHPRATSRDLLLAVLHQEMLSEFNSCISVKDHCVLKEYIMEWLRLCVIEDKLMRLSELSHDEQGMQRELCVLRNWDPLESPAWLVFEVEHCLQIWPEQATVAKHLIDNGGDIVQLNMGMGKTR